MPWLVRVNATTEYQAPRWPTAANGEIYRDAADEQKGDARGCQCLPFVIGKLSYVEDETTKAMRNPCSDGKTRWYAEATSCRIPDDWNPPDARPLLLKDLHTQLLGALEDALTTLDDNLQKGKLKPRVKVARAQVKSLISYLHEPSVLQTRLDFVPYGRILREASDVKSYFGEDIQDWLQNMKLPPVQLKMSHFHNMQRLSFVTSKCCVVCTIIFAHHETNLRLQQVTLLIARWLRDDLTKHLRKSHVQFQLIVVCEEPHVLRARKAPSRPPLLPLALHPTPPKN